MIFMRGLLLLCIFLVACSESNRDRMQELEKWKTPNDKMKILSTTRMINDLVKEVGGEHVDTFTLISGTLDPHSYQLVKGDDEKLAFADLIISNGLGLEHGPSLQRHLQNNHKTLQLGNVLYQRFPHLILRHNGQPDPHIWMDIDMWSKTVPIIVEALSQRDPQHAEDYRHSGELLFRKMQETHADVVQQMLAIPEEKRYLVTSHDAFSYFARAYLASEEEKHIGGWEKRFAAPEGLAPESQLSTTDIQSIIDHVNAFHIQVLFPESNVSKDSIRKIMIAGKEKGLNLCIATTPLYGDAMGEPGSAGDTYLKMIQYNATTIARYLLEEHASALSCEGTK